MFAKTLLLIVFGSELVIGLFHFCYVLQNWHREKLEPGVE